MEHEGWSFLCGWAPAKEFLYCARERDDMAEQDIAITTFYFWLDSAPDPANQWTICKSVVDWRAQGMASVKPQSSKRITVALGANCQYFELEPATTAEYLGVIAGLEMVIRRVAAIGDDIFAVGMGRTAIRRVERGVWRQFGPGVTAADHESVVGFEGIDGFSPDDIYVAGWNGEIWHWIHGAWQQIDSPTNANLNAVACDRRNGSISVVGDNGIMVRGSGDRWDVIDTGRAENLQDVVVFDGETFVVTDYRILRLAPSGLVPEDRFLRGDYPNSCLHLLLASDGVFSLGPKDLFAFSGGTWRRIV